MVGISGKKEWPTKYKWRVDHVFYQSIDQFKKIVTAFKDEPKKNKCMNDSFHPLVLSNVRD